MTPNPRTKRTLTLVLSGLFILALLMGLGPGLALINPDPSDPQAVTAFWNVPVIYLWAFFWFLVQAAAIVTAFFTLWDDGGAS